jgi:hypothetical protein
VLRGRETGSKLFLGSILSITAIIPFQRTLWVTYYRKPLLNQEIQSTPPRWWSVGSPHSVRPEGVIRSLESSYESQKKISTTCCLYVSNTLYLLIKIDIPIGVLHCKSWLLCFLLCFCVCVLSFEAGFNRQPQRAWNFLYIPRWITLLNDILLPQLSQFCD